LQLKCERETIKWLDYLLIDQRLLTIETMSLFRRKKRPASRVIRKAPKWGMKHRRSGRLRFKQLFQGKVLISFGILALLGALIYTVFFTQMLIVNSLQVDTVYKDINVSKLEKFLDKKVVGQHSFFFDLNEIYLQSYEQFPEVSALACHRNYLLRAVNCEAYGFELVAVIKNKGKKYYINENGVVIAYDSRKLGLPLFDLILNPIFVDNPEANELVTEEVSEEAVETSVESETVTETDAEVGEPVSLTDNILREKSEGTVLDDESTEAEAVTEEATESEELSVEEVYFEETGGFEVKRVKFVKPFEDPPIEPVIQNEARAVFNVSVGKKILDPEELNSILEAIQRLEEVLERKVIHAQYVQVAAELSLTSKPSMGEDKPNEEAEAATPDTEEDEEIEEDPEHELTIFLDLRRNLDDQLNKLKKTKEVVDFTQIERIDLSIDGEKVFYR